MVKIFKRLQMWFSEIFGRPTYILRPPSGLTLSEMQRLVNKSYLQENEELKARLAKTEATMESLQKALKEREREERIEEEILKHQKKMKELRRTKILGLRAYILNENGKMIPMDDGVLPTFFLRSNRPLGKWKGIILEETKNGDTVWFPWLSNNSNNGKESRFPVPAPDFISFFQRNIGVVSQILGGKLDSNFDLDRYNKPLFKHPNINPFYPNPPDTNINIRLSDIERERYETQIANLQDEISQLNHILKRFQRREKKYQGKLGKLEGEAEAVKESVDTLSAAMRTLMKYIPEMSRSVADAMGSLGSASVRQKSSEQLSYTLTGVIGDLNRKLREQLPKTEEEIVKARIKQDISELATITEKIEKGKRLREKEIIKIAQLLQQQKGGGETVPKSKT